MIGESGFDQVDHEDVGDLPRRQEQRCSRWGWTRAAGWGRVESARDDVGGTPREKAAWGDDLGATRTCRPG